MLVSSITEKIHMIDSPFHGKTGVLSTYIVDSDEKVIIDPGPTSQIQGIYEGLNKLDIKELRWILLTHIHLDHGAGSWKLLEAFPEADLYCHPRWESHMIDPSKIVRVAKEAFGVQFSMYGEVRVLKEEKVISSSDGEVIELGDVNLQVIWTPGHSTHSQSYFEPNEKVIFVGDSAGHMPYDDIVIPASPPPFNPEDTVESIKKLIGLQPEVICYSHFGFKKAAVERLEKFKDQVELWNSIVTGCVSKAMSLSETFSFLAERDPRVKELLELDPEGKSHVYHSLNGFYSYAQWKMRKK
jgi:glyoxylase-like metal-dependent hydrolase (beta-lactamase superfamily II)